MHKATFFPLGNADTCHLDLEGGDKLLFDFAHWRDAEDEDDLRTRAGLRDMRFHDLRHTFISHLVMEGVDLTTVQKLAGHRDIKTTMRYAHLAPDHLRSAVEKIDPDGTYMDTKARDEGKDHFTRST